MLSSAIIPYVPPKSPMDFIRSEVERMNPSAVPLGLPKELALAIFAFLDRQSLSRCFLVSHDWKLLADDRFLWSEIFRRRPILERENSPFNEAKEYHDIAIKFSQSGLFGAAFAASQVCVQFTPEVGAYSFSYLSKKACDAKRYEAALDFQQLAMAHHADAGNEAESYLIIGQISEANFLDKSDQLIQRAVALIDSDREFGLQALVAIAKKFADLKMFEGSMKYAQLAQSLGEAKTCLRKRNFDRDTHPFTEMSRHMLSLKQYALAEECAKKMDARFCQPANIYADIILAQMEDEDYINESLLAELKPETMPWVQTHEGLVFGLIAKGRYKEGQKLAQIRLQVEWRYGVAEFKRELKNKLDGLGLDSNDWMKL